jgi:hypothetical protein
MELTKITFKYKDKVMGEITVPSGWVMETRNVAMDEFVEGFILEEVEEIEEDEEIIETVPLEPIPEPVSDEPIEEIEETIIIPPEPEEPIDPDKFRITGIQFTYLKKVVDALPDSWHWHMNYTTKFYPLGQSTNWGVHWKPVAKTSRQVTFKIICTPSYGRQVTASKTVDIAKNARGLSVLYRGFPNLSKYVGDFKFEVFAYDGDELLDSKTYVVPGKRKADYE